MAQRWRRKAVGMRDSPPETAATEVRGYILRLRRVLGDAEGRVLITTPAGYRIERVTQDVDVAPGQRRNRRDGRARPIDAEQRRQRVRALVALAPTMSIRQFAREADVSIGTVHAVR